MWWSLMERLRFVGSWVLNHAGDAFTAGLLHRWDAMPHQRIRFAAACGALVCGGAGGIDPQPTQAQVEAFLGGVS